MRPRDPNGMLRLLAIRRVKRTLELSPYGISRGFTLWITKPDVFSMLDSTRVETYGTVVPL